MWRFPDAKYLRTAGSASFVELADGEAGVVGEQFRLTSNRCQEYFPSAVPVLYSCFPSVLGLCTDPGITVEMIAQHSWLAL